MKHYRIRLAPRFSSVPTLSYLIVYKDDISDAEWKTLKSSLIATGVETEYSDETFADSDRRFYRVSVE